METLGGAKTTWQDLVGTASADTSLARGHRSLYQLTELDREAWRIVGVDVGWDAATSRVTVYAADRGDELDDGEPLAVTAFVLDDVRAGEFLQEAFGVLSVRLMSREFRDRPIRVISQVNRALAGP